MNWLFLFFGLLPTTIWLIFFLQEDKDNPEPTKILFFAFLWGVLVTPIVYLVQKIYSFFIPTDAILFSFPSFVFLALTEELGKFLVIYLIIRRSPAFDEPLDAMVYMIMSALGFATVENLLSVFGFRAQPLAYVEVTTLRLIGATLIHSLASAIIGFYWARAMLRKYKIFWAILSGLLIAVLLHAAFNFLIIKFPPLGWPLLIALLAGFFVFRDFEMIKEEEVEKPLSN